MMNQREIESFIRTRSRAIPIHGRMECRVIEQLVTREATLFRSCLCLSAVAFRQDTSSWSITKTIFGTNYLIILKKYIITAF